MPFKDPEKRKEYDKQKYITNKEKILAQKKEYYKNNREKYLEYQKEYRKENRAKVLDYNKKYRETHKEEIAKYQKEYQRERCQNDPIFKMIKYYRIRTCSAYLNNTKSKSTIELLGCNGEELAQHLEKQFQPGMTHDNYGEWHIDHIKPIASFDLSDPEQEQECFHYTNLQPLWAEDNLRKGDKWT